DKSGGLIMIRSTVADNQAGQTGGGVWSLAMPTISESAITGNQATAGGGGLVCHSCALNLTNSTVSNNSTTTGYGGGLSNEGGGLVTILNSTFSGNSATVGGGVSAWADAEHPSPSTTIRNTIIANSVAGGDCFNDVAGSPILAGDHNIIETTSTCNSVATITSDPNLGSLTGSPAYFPLNAGSPAMDAGDDLICAAAPVKNTSQNGVTRPQGAHCDIGAYEAGSTIFLPFVIH
ncbi:MAG: choice-of-anchor Q domain-containing protein, partial [Anaerolineaceae bacterium]|nr:choice-of-anchor Q domain-containing protein [Anaerolineaceae bacterium]